MRLRNTMKGNGNATESSQTPLESMRSGNTYINQITITGFGNLTTRHKDQQSAGDEQDFIRRLTQSKGVVQ